MKDQLEGVISLSHEYATRAISVRAPIAAQKMKLNKFIYEFF